MKKLLADFLSINETEILNYSFNMEHDLSVGKEHDYGNTYDVISGNIYQPQYHVTTKMDNSIKLIDLEDLLIFIYTKKQ